MDWLPQIPSDSFFTKLYYLIVDILGIMSDTANRIDAVQFDGSAITTYLGYAHYAMGNLYTVFTSVILIAIGLAIWGALLKGVGYIKNLLPW